MHQILRYILSLAAALFIIVLPFSGNRPDPIIQMVPRLRPLPPPPAIREGDLPYDALGKALEFLKMNLSTFTNRRFITIIDYSKPSTSQRFFLFDMESGQVRKYLVSHGRNSGWLYATKFSNKPDSLESPLGFFKTGNKYYGSHGPALVLDGLQTGINDNSVRRGIVLHGAPYASWRAIFTKRANNLFRLGRSLGCPAIPLEAAESVIDKIKNGSLLYIYTNSSLIQP